MFRPIHISDLTEIIFQIIYRNINSITLECIGPEEISLKTAELLTPEGTNAEVEIIYQSVSDLHASCPDHQGDWYFTGNYPTPGGVKVVNKAFMNYMEGNNARAY